MAKYQYQPKNFLRHAPNALLDRYFHERNLLISLDIASLDETDVEPIYDAWMQLPPSQRAETEEDFRLIDSVADDHGIVAILEEALFHGENLEPTFAPMDSFHDKATWTFLERRSYLEVAARFREADELPKNYWRERNSIPAIKPRDDRAGCEDLSNILKVYFRHKEGRGYACSVDVFRRGSMYYYFAYPEDHGRSLLEYEGQEDRLRRRVHRPVFEVVFVYDPEKGALSIYYEGKGAVVRELQQLFAREILVMNLPNPDRDDRVYELNPLKYRDFPFRYGPTSGIADVRVKQLKFTIIGRGSRRIAVDVDPSHDREALYDLLDNLLDTRTPRSIGDRLPLTLMNVTKVGIRAYLVPDGRRRRPQKTFYVSFPNGCSLEHEGRDATLRQMLIDSGLEPRRGSSTQLAS